MEQFSILNLLPPPIDLNDAGLLHQNISASRVLSELKGVIKTIPNENILLDTLLFQEAKASSAIENIITTDEELFRANIGDTKVSPATKEAKNYADAVKFGYGLIKQKQLLTLNDILAIQKINAPDYAEVRRIPGTKLKNDQSGETVYTPPQGYDEIMKLLGNLEEFINDPDFSTIDPLVKMAIIHYQFESIHPFHDGNGRLGRILNVLYLTKEKLLDLPILYLSQYIIKNKDDYYRLLRSVYTHGEWIPWCLWMLKGVEVTASNSIIKINKIREMMQKYKEEIREKYKFYSQDLINVLFRYPYTQIKVLQEELKVTRLTATTYLDTLVEGGYLKKKKLGRDSFYFNLALLDIITQEEDQSKKQNPV